MSEDDGHGVLTTRSAFTFRVRPAHDGDEAALAEFFTHVSPDDLRFRFLSNAPRVSHEQLVAMTHVDHRQTENFLAFTEDGLLIATAMIACNRNLERAEVAIAIRSDFKARGVGWELLGHVARIAAARGITIIESIESRENHAAIEVEEDRGFTCEALPDDPTLVRVSKTLVAR